LVSQRCRRHRRRYTRRLVPSPLFGGATINQGAVNPGALLVSLVGGVMLQAIVNLIRRRWVR
jgi:hypothetical protein